MAGTSTPVIARGETTVHSVRGRLILPLPQAASDALPSRGQVAVHGRIAGHEVSTVVEPDGRKGHWLSVQDLRWSGAAPDLTEGTSVAFELTTAPQWPEPQVPADLAAALEDAEAVGQTWQDITPMARWEWVRWVQATKNPSTRARRVEVAISKLLDGKRRPCCFDLASCTDPQLASSGKLRLES